MSMNHHMESCPICGAKNVLPLDAPVMVWECGSRNDTGEFVKSLPCRIRELETRCEVQRELLRKIAPAVCSYLCLSVWETKGGQQHCEECQEIQRILGEQR